MIRHQTTKSALWIAGLAGAATSADAALVQIDLTGMSVTAGGGNTLPVDLGLVMGVSFSANNFIRTFGVRFSSFFGEIMVGSAVARASSYYASYTVSTSNYLALSSFSRSPAVITGFGGGSVRGGFDVSIVADGVTHMAKLLVTAGGRRNSRGVTLDALIYDDNPANAANALPSAQILVVSNPTVIGSVATSAGIQAIADANAVPEPSGLALLAMGAAGVVTRRQRKKVV